MTTTVTIVNGEELLRKINAIPAATIVKLREAMARQADEIVDFMKRLAPVLKKPDKRRVPGALRNSIGWRWGERLPAGSVELGQVRAPVNAFGGQLTLTIYAGSESVYYARWVEFGTVRMPKQPFFFPAYRANRKKAKNAMRAAVRAAAREVAAS